MHRFLLTVLFLVPAFASAQQSAVEVTPFAGYRFGGTFETEDETARYELEDSASFGVLVNLPHKTNTQWEILYSQQGSAEAIYEGDPGPDPLVDVDIHVLQIGGTYLFEGERAIPYLAATLGGTHIRTTSTESTDDTFFSGSIGIGMKFLPTSRVGIRVEARAYGTLISSDSALFCSTGPDANVCAVRIDGKLFSQVETFAGITFRF
jgi:opacity protein-like surface antigen